MLTKICTKCKKEQTINYFYKSKSGKYGVRSLCKTCQHEYNQKPEIKKREYERKNTEKYNEHRKKYRKTLKGKETSRRWKQNNPEKVSVNRQNRRALTKSVPGSIKESDIKQKFLEQEGKCYYCNNIFISTEKCPKGYHIDHKIPLSRTELNPTNNLENICLACPSCNLRKWNRTEEEFKLMSKLV